MACVMPLNGPTRSMFLSWSLSAESFMDLSSKCEFAGPVNSALLALSEWETRLVRRLNLPFGVTVVCVAQKQAGGA